MQKALRKCLCDMWGDTKGQTIVGFGFATPLLRPFLAKARRIIALMPAEQGVIAWPGDTGEHLANCAVLCEELHWPIANGQVDKLVLLHALETCTDTDALLDEIWRVLGPGGRVVFIVSNRSGLWARSDKTPFGVGRPYSVGQVEHLLRLHKFVPERHFPALYFCPFFASVLAADGGVLGLYCPSADYSRGCGGDFCRGKQAGLCASS